MNARDVLDFWFIEHGPEDWFGGDPAFDARCAKVLAPLHARAVKCELWDWRRTPEGRVAEIILLDQLSRQLFRGQAQAFASDTMALALAQEVVMRGKDSGLSKNERLFVYMPFQHAESLPVQEESVRLFGSLDDEDLLKFAQDHHDTIARFGRFPKRNAALGRTSTPQEEAYIAERDDAVF